MEKREIKRIPAALTTPADTRKLSPPKSTTVFIGADFRWWSFLELMLLCPYPKKKPLLCPPPAPRPLPCSLPWERAAATIPRAGAALPPHYPCPTTAHMSHTLAQQLFCVSHASDNGMTTTTSAPVLLITEPRSLDICLHLWRQCYCCTKHVCTPDSGAAVTLHMLLHQTWHCNDFTVLRHWCYHYSEHDCMPNPAPRKIFLTTTFPYGE